MHYSPLLELLSILNSTNMSIRVVSLLPSAAEIIGLFAARNDNVKLVGRSHEDDHPSEIVKDIPILTAAKYFSDDF
jgi:hypothetical protein